MSDINTGEKLNKGYILRALCKFLPRSNKEMREEVADDFITKIERDRAFFITTIESQKEEIERLNSYKVIKNYTDMLVENNSLKAITELAVKGLNESKIALKHTASLAHLPSCTCPPCNAIGFVEYTISEIERLQNE